MMEYYEKIKQQGYYLIAEIGVNYYEIAKKEQISPLEAAILMMKQAKEAGADAAKFQTYKAENLVMVDSPGSWDRNDIEIETQYELFKLYDRFGEKEYAALCQAAKKIGIEFMSTPFDLEAVEYLDKYLNVYKISSSDISNFPLVEAVARKNKPIILSTGASDLAEIEKAVELIKKYNDKQLTLLHCVLEYPTPYEHANLNKIKSLAERFPDMIIGYSDHTLPDEHMDVLKTAYQLGARVIEKHFTLDKTIKKMNDHFHSMDCKDLRTVKDGIELIKKISGDGNLVCLASEMQTRNSVRRSAVSRRIIKKGEKLTEDMIIYKRPGSGLSPEAVAGIMGRVANRDIEQDIILDAGMFE